MHVFTDIVNTIWLKVYGYDYGMICFDTRFWYFTKDGENIFQHSNIKDMRRKFDRILSIEGKSLK